MTPLWLRLVIIGPVRPVGTGTRWNLRRGRWGQVWKSTHVGSGCTLSVLVGSNEDLKSGCLWHFLFFVNKTNFGDVNPHIIHRYLCRWLGCSKGWGKRKLTEDDISRKFSFYTCKNNRREHRSSPVPWARLVTLYLSSDDSFDRIFSSSIFLSSSVSWKEGQRRYLYYRPQLHR